MKTDQIDRIALEVAHRTCTNYKHVGGVGAMPYRFSEQGIKDLIRVFLERIAAEAEPVAWQHRQRGLNSDKWQEWETVSWKPQGPESSQFQMRPLYPAPQAAIPEWQDIATAPKDVDLLLWCGWCITGKLTDKGFVTEDGANPIYHVTKWMHQPKAPA